MNENNNDNKIKRIFNIDESIYAQVGADVNNDAEMKPTVSDILRSEKLPVVDDRSYDDSSYINNTQDQETNNSDIINEPISNNINVDYQVTEDSAPMIDNQPVSNDVNSYYQEMENNTSMTDNEAILNDDVLSSIESNTSNDTTAEEPIVAPTVEDIFPSVEEINEENVGDNIAPEIADVINEQDAINLEDTPQELVVNYQDEDVSAPINRDDMVNNYNDTFINNVASNEDSYFNSVDDILENSEDINLYTQQPKAPMPEEPPMMVVPTIPPEPEEAPMEVPTYVPEPDRFGFNAASAYDDHQFLDQTEETYQSSPYVTPSYMADDNNVATYETPSNGTNFIPKSEFASRPDMGESNFDRNMRRHTRPINFVLFGLYAVCFSIIIFVGYNIYLNSATYYASRNNIKLLLGSSYSELIYKNGELQNNSDFEWSSSNPEVATVDKDGNISSVSNGNAVITYTSKKGKRHNIINVNVISLTIESFKLDNESRTVYVGNTFTIIPIVNDQTTITLDLVWSSSDPEVATVDKEGIVTIKSAGNAQIIVSIPETNFKATMDIKVLDKK